MIDTVLFVALVVVTTGTITGHPNWHTWTRP